MPKNLGALGTISAIEIQLKNGFLKKVPAYYEAMKRFPPGTPDIDIEHELPVDRNKLSYIKYYKKALEKNPLFVGDNLYPAFWRQQPIAMDLAKKQQALINEGKDEETAYKLAMEYVQVKENESYESMKKLLENITLLGAKVSFLSSPENMKQIEIFRNLLKRKTYDSLDLAEKGEIDYFIQNNILQWNEVDRQRRMRDPIFFQQFEKLRNLLFPEIITNLDSNKEDEKRRQLMLNFLQLNGLTPEYICTTSPFFYDTYYAYFELLRVQPLFHLWKDEERNGLNQWISQAVAYREFIEKKSLSETQRSLDLLRLQFFPMILYPYRGQEFKIPSLKEIRSILYQNDIGYKTYRNKLFIKRFYKLPFLFFPLETIATKYCSDMESLKGFIVEDSIEEGDNALLNDLHASGLSDSNLPLLRNIIEEFYQNIYNRNTATSSMNTRVNVDARRNGTNNSNDIVEEVQLHPSMIAELAKASGYQHVIDQNRNTDVNTTTTTTTTNESSASSELAATDDVDNSDNNMNDLGEDDNDDFTYTIKQEFLDELEPISKTLEYHDHIQDFLTPIPYTTDITFDHIQLESQLKLKEFKQAQITTHPDPEPLMETKNKDEYSTQEWNKIVNKYYPTPKTTLEKERAQFLGAIEYSDWKKCETEHELYMHRYARTEDEVVIRARLGYQYEEKETARLEKVYEERGLTEMYTELPLTKTEIKLASKVKKMEKLRRLRIKEIEQLGFEIPYQLTIPLNFEDILQEYRQHQMKKEVALNALAEKQHILEEGEEMKGLSDGHVEEEEGEESLEGEEGEEELSAASEGEEDESLEEFELSDLTLDKLSFISAKNNPPEKRVSAVDEIRNLGPLSKKLLSKLNKLELNPYRKPKTADEMRNDDGEEDDQRKGRRGRSRIPRDDDTNI